jgi:hypothetical protein
LEVIAFGWLRLTPDQLYDLTPREFSNMLWGFEQLEKKRDRCEWDKFRLLATTLITPHTKKGRGVRPEQLWPFEWDKKKEETKMSKERLEYLTERSKKLRPKTNG